MVKLQPSDSSTNFSLTESLSLLQLKSLMVMPALRCFVVKSTIGLTLTLSYKSDSVYINHNMFILRN